MRFDLPSRAKFAIDIEPGETVAGWMLVEITETAQQALSLTFEKRNREAPTATRATFKVDYSASIDFVANILANNAAPELTQAP